MLSGPAVPPHAGGLRAGRARRAGPGARGALGCAVRRRRRGAGGAGGRRCAGGRGARAGGRAAAHAARGRLADAEGGAAQQAVRQPPLCLHLLYAVRKLLHVWCAHRLLHAQAQARRAGPALCRDLASGAGAQPFQVHGRASCEISHHFAPRLFSTRLRCAHCPDLCRHAGLSLYTSLHAPRA